DQTPDVFQYNVIAPPALTLNSAVSRKNHGGTDYDVALPLTGDPGVECRSGNATNEYTIVYTFSNHLVGSSTVDSISVPCSGSVSSSAVDGTDDHNYIVTFSGITC